jgi:hypothetical protein
MAWIVTGIECPPSSESRALLLPSYQKQAALDKVEQKIASRPVRRHGETMTR